MYVISTNLRRLLYPLAIAIGKASGYTQPRNLATRGIPSSLQASVQPIKMYLSLSLHALFVVNYLSFLLSI